MMWLISNLVFQVREQSKENAAKIRQAVKHEKHKQLMKLATEIKVCILRSKCMVFLRL